MSRETYVIRDGKLVSKSDAYTFEASDAPNVISDHFKQGALWHPLTGEMIDSKSTFRRVTRAHGGEEIGNEVQRDTRSIEPRCARDDVARSINMLKHGYRPTVLPESFE